MDHRGDQMKNIVHVVETILRWVGALALAAMLGLTCIDVIMRAVGRPVVGAVELVGYLATITIACALPHTHIMRGHASVDMLVRRLSPRLQGIVDLCTSLTCLGLFGVIAWQMFRYASTLMNSGEVSMTLELPTHVLVWVVGISFGALGLVVIPDISRSWRKVVGE